MKVHVLTLFPRLFDDFLRESIVGIARDKGHLQVDLVDYRDYTSDRHRTVDDRPFGGGPGMVIKPEPVFDAVEDVLSRGNPDMPKVLVTPQGEPFDQRRAEWLAAQPEWRPERIGDHVAPHIRNISPHGHDTFKSSRRL